MFIDRKHQFAHGSLLKLESSLSTVMRYHENSIGSGVTLYSFPHHLILDFNKRASLIPRGSFRSSVQHLNQKDIQMVQRLTSHTGLSHEVCLSMGSLGEGNDFVELVGWKGKLFLLVHSNSRFYSSVVLRGREPTEQLSIDEASRIVTNGNILAKLNRDIIARIFGCNEEILDSSHSDIIHPYECKSFGIPEGTWWSNGVTKSLDFSLILGAPGNGAAYLETGNALVPHGTGGKGARFRPLKGISGDRYLVCLMRLGHHPTSEATPTGAAKNQNLVA
jgi:hypothetical protein